MDGQDIACPSCGRETTLMVPELRVRKAAAENPTAGDIVQSSTIICSYILSALVPLAGFFAGLYLMRKKQDGHGIACMGLSILFALLFIGILSGL